MQKKRIELDNERMFEYVKTRSPMAGPYRDYYAHLVSQNKDMMQMSAMTVIERQLLDDLLHEVQKETSALSYQELQSKEVV
jgi:FKBP-type peptidyl-prolyl cis-trans isomerase (trigger factor)